MVANSESVPNEDKLKKTIRYVTGQPLDGYDRTDCTFLLEGSEIVALDGQAIWWDFLPGWKRAVTRVICPVAGAIALHEQHHYAGLTWSLATTGALAWCYVLGKSALEREEQIPEDEPAPEDPGHWNMRITGSGSHYKVEHKNPPNYDQS